MKVLCIGDIHIKPSNTHLVDLLEEQILRHIETHEITHVVLLGDILDTFERIHTQALNRAYQLIQNLRDRVIVYILVGNHDLINNQQFLTTQHWMNALKDWKNVYVADRVLSENNMLFVPYVPPGRFTEALDTSALDWKSVDYIFAHQELKGCKMGAIVSVTGDEWDESWPTVISGHIHDRQIPQTNIYYIGASIQNSFGDQTLPILLLLDPHERSMTELTLELPRKKTLYMDIDKIQQFQTDKISEEKNLDTVRLVVKCDYEEFKVFTKTKEYEELVANPKCKIVHKPVTTTTKEEPDFFGTLDAVLYQKVLNRMDERLYSTYMKVIHDIDINPEEVLIV